LDDHRNGPDAERIAEVASPAIDARHAGADAGAALPPRD